MVAENLPILMVGSRGATKEVYHIIKKINTCSSAREFDVLGLIDNDNDLIGTVIFDNIRVISTDATLERFVSQYKKVGLIIPVGDPKLKEKLYLFYKRFNNIIFPNVIHPDAVIEGDLHAGIGNIISAGTVIGCDTVIGNFNLINRCCTTGHDVMIGNYNTINPGSVVSGNVNIGNGCLLGAGSIILQGISLEDCAILGAGAVLTTTGKTGETLVGIPAKNIKSGQIEHEE